MERFVPRDKMNKKARRAMDRQRRAVWTLCPVTRVKESVRGRSRDRADRTRYADIGE